jgi:hypothetical protein
MKFVLQCDMNNAAFGETVREGKVELARILGDLLKNDADLLRAIVHGVSLDLRDINGNTIGEAKIVED